MNFDKNSPTMEVDDFTSDKKQSNLPYLSCFHNLLSKDECQSLIDYMEKHNHELVERGAMATYFRVQMTSKDIAEILYKRIEPYLPENYLGIPKSSLYLNDHFRFSKYHPGQEFKIHRDGFNMDADGGRSLMTLNIFLNDQFDGGETDFFYDEDDADDDDVDNDEPKLRYRAKPKPGRGCLFHGNNLLHCGNKVENGYKYLLRTDLMTNAP